MEENKSNTDHKEPKTSPQRGSPARSHSSRQYNSERKEDDHSRFRHQDRRSPRERRRRYDSRERPNDDDNPKIYIKNIPIDIQKKDLEEIFGEFGRI